MTRNKIMVLLDMLMEHSELEMVQINGLDIIYNPYINSGEWQVFEHDSEHKEYAAFDDILALADTIVISLDK